MAAPTAKAGGAVGVVVTVSVAWPLLLRATRASVASISGSPSAARPARVERSAGTAARLCSTSPPCFLTCTATIASTPARCVGVEVTSGDELVGQAPGLVAGPGLEGGDELALVDQAVLKREQSEEEMAVGGGGHGMAPIVVGRAGAGPGLGAGPASSPIGPIIAGPPCLCIRAAGCRRTALIVPP